VGSESFNFFERLPNCRRIPIESFVGYGIWEFGFMEANRQKVLGKRLMRIPARGEVVVFQRPYSPHVSSFEFWFFSLLII
jgi:hypothetical protein